MSQATPFVSVVIPTHDRPQFVQWCVASVLAQTFDDFEVVVCDNPVRASAKNVVAGITDPRVRYLDPDGPLTMADNWDRAISQARGEWVVVLADKMALGPHALASIASTAKQSDVDAVSWRNSAYLLQDEAKGVGPGYYVHTSTPKEEPTEYTLRSALEKRLSFDVRRERLGADYGRAKICFGGFRQTLVERIRSAAGKVCYPITPDYTSTGAASGVGGKGIDVGVAHVVSFESVTSNGKAYVNNVAHARRFFDESDPTGELLAQLPIPGLFASVHNLVAYDLTSSATRAGGADIVSASLNLANLAARAAEDLALVQCPDAESQQALDQQTALLTEWTAARGIGASASRGSLAARTRARARRALAKSQPLERLALTVAGRRPVRYDDIVQAAAANMA